MKLGLPLAVAAVSLFSATIIWSTQKSVEREVFRLEYYPLDKPPMPPSRRDPALFFYPAEKVLSVNIQAPVDVELDEGFMGVELRGDTSVFKYLRVSTKYGQINVGLQSLASGRASGPIQSAIDTDSISRMIKTASIMVRVGIGSGEAERNRNRRLSFANCNKVSAATTLHGRNLSLYLHQTDSVQLSVNLKALEIMHNGTRPGTSMGLLRLSGTVNQLYISPIQFTKLDGTQLLAKEVYVRQAKNASLDLYASEIANIQTQDTSCTVKLSGNPPYTRLNGEGVGNY